MADRERWIAIRFIDEPVPAQFEKEPALVKKPGCPSGFVWQGQAHQIVELLSEWHDYRRRGRMARNMRPTHREKVQLHGSWGVGRDFYRVRTAEERTFDLYYDRAPKGSEHPEGGWYLYRELKTAV